jgi:hypothetical protein
LLNGGFLYFNAYGVKGGFFPRTTEWIPYFLAFDRGRSSVNANVAKALHRERQLHFSGFPRVQKSCHCHGILIVETIVLQ